MKTRILPIMMSAALATPAVWAHHSAGSLYRLDRTIRIDGVVKEYRFVNPHVRIYVEVTTVDGVTELWLAEGQSKNVLVREGWTGAELEPGEAIRLSGNPPRDGSRAIQWSTITRADGTELGGGSVKDFRSYIDRLRQR